MTLAGQQKRGEKIHAPKSDRRPYAGLGRVGRAIDRTSPDLQHRPRIDAAGPGRVGRATEGGRASRRTIAACPRKALVKR